MSDYAEVRAKSVTVSGGHVTVELVDGRILSVPVSWFPLLESASESELQNVELLGGGVGLHWPELDEDLSVKGLLAGTRCDR